MRRRMTQFLALALVAFAALAGTAFGQSHPVEGTYTVTATGNEIGTVTFTMTLKRSGDKWVGEVTDSPLPLTVTSVEVDASNKVTIVASTGDAAVTIAGMFESGKIAGDWTAGEAKGAWSGLRKDAAATAVAAAPAASTGSNGATAATAGFEGTYDAEVVADGQGSLPFTLVVKKDGEKLVAEVPGAGDLNIVGIEVAGETVTLKATFQGNPFDLPGKMAAGEMGGKWEAGGFTGTWKAKKK